MLPSDEDAIYFETANNGEGPDVTAEISRADFEAIVAAQGALAASEQALKLHGATGRRGTRSGLRSV